VWKDGRIEVLQASLNNRSPPIFIIIAIILKIINNNCVNHIMQSHELKSVVNRTKKQRIDVKNTVHLCITQLTVSRQLLLHCIL